MAIEIYFEDEFGNKHSNAYVRISKFIIDNPLDKKFNISFEIEIYVNEQTRLSSRRPLFGPQVFSFAIEDVDSISNIGIDDAYKYLKTLDEFKNAKDV